MSSPFVHWVLERIDFPNNVVHILDPECGDGRFLYEFALLAKDMRAKLMTYGLEPNIRMSHEARKRLDRVLPGGYNFCEVSHRSFSMVYTKPRETNREERPADPTLAQLLPSREKDIFQRATTYLQVGGVLAMQVRRSMLKELANLIAYRLDYPEIALIGENAMIFGVRASARRNDEETRNQLLAVRRWVEETADLKEHIFLPEATRRHALPVTNGPSLFKTSIIDPELLAESMEKSTLWRQVDEWFKPELESKHRPPLPLHLGHIGLLLSTGLLDGRVGNHLMKGRVVKVKSERSEETDDGVEVHSQHERYKVQVRVLEADGSYFDL